MFPEINYFKQFLRKNIIKDQRCVHKIALQIHCSLTKVHNNTYKVSTPVKELTVFQNTYSHVESLH